MPKEKAMIKRIISVGIFLLLSGNAFAEFTVYTIDKKLEAVFPAKPQFTGELGKGKQKSRSYNHTDENNIIVYNATYQVGTVYFNENEVIDALRYYVQGQVQSVNGKLISKQNKIIGGNKSVIFSISFQFQGVSGRKYSVVSYKNGHFYQWSVQDLPGHSKLAAKKIFNTYVGNFSVK